MKHKETDSVEPDDLPFIHIFWWFRHFHPFVALLVAGFGPLFLQLGHGLKRSVFAKQPDEKQPLAERAVMTFGFTRIAWSVFRENVIDQLTYLSKTSNLVGTFKNNLYFIYIFSLTEIIINLCKHIKTILF